MIGRKFGLSALAASLVMLPSAALAAPAVQAQAEPVGPRAGTEIQLAQAREVDVFYDARGRRVILDAFTGEVIAIEPPGRALPRVVTPGDLGNSRVVVVPPAGSDLSAIERYRRYRERQLGLGERPRDFDPYRQSPQAFPEPPREPLLSPDFRDPPEIARRDPILRETLPENPVTGSTPHSKIVPEPMTPPKTASDEEVAKLQVLLDRAGLSPGVIDGKLGGNVQKALDALAEMTGERLAIDDKATIERGLTDTGGPAFVTYTITPEDAAGPFVASVPADYGEKARLDRLSFTSTVEMLAERFHMDEAYLKALNPGADFSRPGTQVKVADIGVQRNRPVARIVADKGREQVRAYDADGNLITAYPATIGSTDTPSPSGEVSVERIAFDPEYTYNPKLNFKQGDNDRILTIPPGPNGPVGSIWIALSKPTYGIHGTPEPSRIGKSNSHGCVRLTNWDAYELAKMVTEGVTVEFLD